MRLKISTPEKSVYQGEIKSVSLPTDSGTITITDSSAPMVTSLKTGIVTLVPFETTHTPGYIFSKNEILISIGKGMAFVDGKIIRIVASSATTIPTESAESLKKKKEALENEIKQLKMKGSIEQLSSKMNTLEKINADLQLEAVHSHA
jgi:F-type H+-transporting ATPase subunit epsilon